MVYESLKTEEASDSDVDSIQRSPLLETGDWAPPDTSDTSDLSENGVNTPPSAPIPPGPQLGRQARYSVQLEDKVDSPHTQIRVMSRQRPKSAFIRPPDIANQFDKEEEEEDALPFEDTKKMASQGRPRSVVELSQLNGGGKIISKTSFDNYRKSISTLDDLNRSLEQELNTSMAEQGANTINESEDEEAIDQDLLKSEKERKRQIAKERQIQDARLSIYRQSMTKVIGGSEATPISSSMPHLSTIGLVESDEEDDDLMDDVPLSILQAHGFPKERRKSHSSRMSISPSTSYNIMPPSPHTSSSSPPRPASISANTFRSIPVPNQHQYEKMPAIPDLIRPSSNVFAEKDAPLTRGLVARIEEEKKLRSLRKTGYDTKEFKKPAPSVMSIPVQQQQPEIENLQNKLELVIQMLSNITSSPATSTHSMGFEPMMQTVRPSPSIRSFNTFSTQSPVSQYPSLDSHYTNAAPVNMNPNASIPSVTNESRLLNRPSRVRLVNVEDDEEDDEEELKKLIEQRKLLKQKWAQ